MNYVSVGAPVCWMVVPPWLLPGDEEDLRAIGK